MTDPLAPYACTPAELKALIAVERQARPFLAYRDADGRLATFILPASDDSVTIGRREGVDVWISWDTQTSGVHAELRCVGGEWTIIDDGLSTNGTFVNAHRVTGRQRLRDGDRVGVGRTLLVFRLGGGTTVVKTAVGDSYPDADQLTAAQRRVLIALCRPQLSGGAYSPPASNLQIAAELFVTLDTVKMVLRALFARFALNELPPNQKRAALAQFALRSGLVSRQDVSGRG